MEGGEPGSGLAGLQRAHQADSSRQQRTLAALDKKLAKDEALLKCDVASMLEKRGEDASASAVSCEVTRRRQAWESELLQVLPKQQQPLQQQSHLQQHAFQQPVRHHHAAHRPHNRRPAAARHGTAAARSPKPAAAESPQSSQQTQTHPALASPASTQHQTSTSTPPSQASCQAHSACVAAGWSRPDALAAVRQPRCPAHRHPGQHPQHPQKQHDQHQHLRP